MSGYTVEFTRRAEKDFDMLPPKMQQRAVDAIALLAQNPHSELLTVKKLRGATHLYRIRLGDYRIVYELRDERLVIVVIRIGNRSNVYRR